MVKRLKEISKDIRKHVVRMHAKANSSHIGSAFSCVDILVTLFFKIMKINPKKPKDERRDRFILSKGHAASSLYATLAKRGFFSENALEKYCINNSKFFGHSTKDCVAGVEVSVGSLGHGLSMGIGMAIASRHEKYNYRVFTLLSDGECNEGSTWEAAMFAGHHRLDNLVAIIDYNKLQAFGRTNKVLNLEPLADRWISFGWSVKEVDGHNFKQVAEALRKIPFKKAKPSLLIAHTVKGKGVSFMEDRLEWHYKSPDKKELETALEEIDSL